MKTRGSGPSGTPVALILPENNYGRRTLSYSIENLDVYRKSIATAAGLCRSSAEAAKKGFPALARELEERAVGLVTNLADGLGFWEKENKVSHFSASKRAALEALPLLEVMASLGAMEAAAGGGLAGELRDLAKMINGLLRGARRREAANGRESSEAAVAGEPSPTYH